MNTDNVSASADAVIANTNQIPSTSSGINSNASSRKPINQQFNPGVGDPIDRYLARWPGNSDFEISSYGFVFKLQHCYVWTGFGPLAKATCWSVSQKEMLWKRYIGPRVLCCCLSTKYVLISCMDGTLHFFNIRTGISILPVLQLATIAVQCAFCPLGNFAGIVSKKGHVRVWDIQGQIIWISASLGDFTNFDSISNFMITKNGSPVVLFSNGNCYSFSKKFDCWMVLTSRDPIMQVGLQKWLSRDVPRSIEHFPLISSQAESYICQENVIDSNFKYWQDVAKLNFIENQIKLCEALNSPDELVYWYSLLAYYLAFNGTEKQIRNLLDYLLHIANVCHFLMDTVLSTLQLAPRWQNIYVEYSEMLKVILRRSGNE